MTEGRLRTEAGFTLIEVLVAALILVLGAVLLGGLLISGQAQASADVQQTQLMDVADAKIEQVRSLEEAKGFDALALAVAPTPAGTGPGLVQNTWANPDSFLQPDAGCGAANLAFEIESNYDAGTTPDPPAGFMAWQNCGTDGEPLQVQSDGLVTSANGGPCSGGFLTDCTVTIGSSTATVDTYVTDTYVACDNTNPNNVCPALNSAQTEVTGCATASSFPTDGSQSTLCADARRVTVVVVPAATGTAAHLNRITPLYLSTIFTNGVPDTGATGPVGITLGVGL